jgi:hypothetical protein
VDQRNLGKSAVVTVLAFVPLLAYWWIVEFSISPPFWNYWNHWELTFYYTSRELVDGYSTHIASGPGTPVQVLGYLILKMIGTQPTSYPQFLLLAHSLILALCVAASFLFQHFLFDKSNRMLSIVCVWFYFTFGASLVYLQVWAPEALYFPFGLLFIIAFLKMLETLPEIDDFRVSGSRRITRFCL